MMSDFHAYEWPDAPLKARNGDPHRSGTVWFLAGRLSAQETLRMIPIDVEPFVIGRSPHCQLTISSQAVSSIHAEICIKDGTIALRDLGSTNGTYLNGTRITGVVEVRPDDLVHFADAPFRLLRQSASVNDHTVCEDVVDHAMALVQFDKLISDGAVIPHYQPVIAFSTGETLAYEVLARSSISGLNTPAQMFSAAAVLSLESKLSHMVRVKAVEETRSLNRPPHIFVNTHPVELVEPGLCESLAQLRSLASRQPITLEIHEKAVSDPQTMHELREHLLSMDIGLAFDDFGAGQARLSELSKVQPDYVKFDMSLIRAIHQASAEHQRMVANLVGMTNDLGITALAEGVECEEESETCRQIGFELAQGFYFGHPIPLQQCRLQ